MTSSPKPDNSKWLPLESNPEVNFELEFLYLNQKIFKLKINKYLRSLIR